MNTPTLKMKDIADLQPKRSMTRSPDEPLGEGVEEAYAEVEPAMFRDGPSWALQAAVSDPDVEDTIGGE